MMPSRLWGYLPAPFEQWGDGSVIRFKGIHTIKGDVIVGDLNYPPSFLMVFGKGLVYLTGRGNVTLENGRTIVLAPEK